MKLGGVLFEKMHIAHDDRNTVQKLMGDEGGGHCFSLLTPSVCGFYKYGHNLKKNVIPTSNRICGNRNVNTIDKSR